ncbi:MAG: DNA-binding response regulator [Acidobacteria bacterium]|nr:MAG: DNA-binding response regulator [Acidobacteriota bacterium]
MKTIRILIVEDHATVREGLKLIISAQPDMEVVADTGDGRSAMSLAQQLEPDIVLMDISLPGLNGLKATALLKECCPDAHVLALTRHQEDGYLQQMLRAGASGYILKQSPPAELLHAIRAVANGGKYLDSAVAGKMMGSYVGRAAGSPDVNASLTDRETEVLRLISWGHSNKEIATRLDLSVKTVETHKANGMKKLGISSRIDIVRYAVLQGWLDNS